MAANDYYYGGSGSNNHHPPPNSSPSPGPYSYKPEGGTAYNSQTPGASSSPAPPYAPSSVSALSTSDRPPQKPTSPFESIFDDHVYPLDQRQQGYGHSNNAYDSSMSSLPQPQDTAYYGHGRVSPDGPMPPRGENIPLEDRPPRPPHKDVEMANDHVYDSPESGRPTPEGQGKKKRGHIGLGQLGMFGADSKRIPWVVYIFSVVHVAVFVGEIVRNATLTGSPIMLKPFFNPMIGPSTFVLINMGARYVPCMHNIDKIQGSNTSITWPCPNSTTLDGTCSLSDLCGFGGIPEPKYDGNVDQSPQPNQWYRFIISMFLHAGLIHIGFNLLLQLTIGKEMERAIGSIRFFLVYISAGIFGFVFGGNYLGESFASTGASGSLFGIIALLLLDLLYSWQDRRNPVKDLLFILLDIIISLVLGLLPGLDNFSHIGGFVVGLGLGVCILHSPNALRRRLGSDSSYATVNNAAQGELSFLKNPTGFFRGRKPLWWAWWLVRAACLLAVIIGFIVLLNNFYIYRQTCSWCKYLSCVPISNWCDIGGLNITQEEKPANNSNQNAKRMLAEHLTTQMVNLFI